MAVTVKDIRFGVEVETVGCPREQVARAVQTVVGGEVTHVGHPSCYDPWECLDTTGRVWRVVADSSLASVEEHLRAELVSPVLGYDDIPVLQAVIRAVRAAGARVDGCCGQHVHVSHPSVTPKSLATLAKLVYKQEPLIYAALGVTRERMTRYCRPIRPEFIRRLTASPPRTFRHLNSQWFGKYVDQPQRYGEERYSILNYTAYFFRGAVEMRAYAGSLHAGKIKAAILFSMALLARAINAHGASARRRAYDPVSAKYDFRVFLISALGMNGDEYRSARKHLLALMPGDSAFKQGREGRPKRRSKTTNTTPGAEAEMLRPS